jgi:tetratricopeptide (TPR) repeat protein
VSLDAIEDVPALGGELRWKPVRRELGIRAFGMNAYAADAGQQVVEEHDELKPDGSDGHEEVYLVVRGRVRFTIDGEDHEVPAGSLVHLPNPEARRSAVAVEDGTLVVAVGAEPGVAFQPSAWEWSFIAAAHSHGGDHDRAVAVLRDALPEYDDDPGVHYNLACFLTLAGRPDEAIPELCRALELAPDAIRKWAESDSDLDALRGRADWPV